MSLKDLDLKKALGTNWNGIIRYRIFVKTGMVFFIVEPNKDIGAYVLIRVIFSTGKRGKSFKHPKQCHSIFGFTKTIEDGILAATSYGTIKAQEEDDTKFKYSGCGLSRRTGIF